jgi:hypothetical protein
MDFAGANWPPANCLDSDPYTYCSTYGYLGRDAWPSINVSYPCPGGSTALSKVVVVPRQGQDPLSAFQLDFRNASGAIDAPSAGFIKQQLMYTIALPQAAAEQAPAGPAAAAAAGSGPAGDTVTVAVSLAVAIAVVVVAAAALVLVCVRTRRQRSGSSSADLAGAEEALQKVRCLEWCACSLCSLMCALCSQSTWPGACR